MSTFLTSLLAIIGSWGGELICKMLQFVFKIFKCYVDLKKINYNIKKEQKKEEIRKKIEDVVDNGSLQDLLDIRK